MRRAQRRALAATSVTAGLVFAALVAGPAAPAQARGNPANQVTFSSSPATSQIVAHYTVRASQRTQSAQTSSIDSATQDKLPDLSPKNFDRARSAALAKPSVITPAQVGGSAPAPSASFVGQQGSGITCSYFAQGCSPPDMAIAASTQFVMQGVNTQWEVWDTSGHVQPGWPVSAQSFFQIPNVDNCDPASGNQPFLSDPRLIYDPIDGRFWAAMLQVEGGLGVAEGCPTQTLYWIAVSQTNDPRGAWNVYGFEMAHGTPFAADYTQIGLNSQALFFSANMFSLDETQFYSEVFEANKSAMERGSGNFTADGFAGLQADGPGIPIAGFGPFAADTVQPVNASTEPRVTDGYFVDSVDGPDPVTGNLCSDPISDPCKGVILWRMRNPVAHDHGGPAPTLTATYLANTVPFAFPPAADEPGCTECIDGNDLRIAATPVLRDDTIYTGWGSGLYNGDGYVPGIVWARINVSNPSVQTGYFVQSGDNAVTYPAFVPQPTGKVVMIYEHMSSTTNPETRYTVQDDSGGPFANPGRLLKAGDAVYRPGVCSSANVCRWGDYEATSYDGAATVWIAGEYANSHTSPTTAPWFGRNWGTWIGALLPS